MSRRRSEAGVAGDDEQEGRARAAPRPGAGGDGAEMAELREQLRLRDAFLLALAHDLRSSVAAIAGANELLRTRASDGDGIDQLLDIIEEAASAIQVVITNLFDVERLRHGTIEVVRQPTDLAELLHRSATDAAPAGRVEVEVEPAIADLDPGLTERILWNLLTNAIVHAPSAAPVVLRGSCEDDRVLLRIEDAGPGIPPELRDELFEPFNRGPGGVGTGVGLYVAREFARVQGGDVWIDSRAGGGTAVHVHLPC